MKQWRSGTAKSLKKAENLYRQKGTCMKYYDVEVLDAETSFFFFSQEATLGHM